MKTPQIKVEFFILNNGYVKEIIDKEMTFDEYTIFLTHFYGYIRLEFCERNNSYQISISEKNYNKTLESIENQ